MIEHERHCPRRSNWTQSCLCGSLARAKQANYVQRARIRMDTIDKMPAELRACVHEYGFRIVADLAQLGISEPRHIRHIVETVLDEFSPTRCSSSAQGPSTRIAREMTEAWVKAAPEDA